MGRASGPPQNPTFHPRTNMSPKFIGDQRATSGRYNKYWLNCPGVGVAVRVAVAVAVEPFVCVTVGVDVGVTVGVDVSVAGGVRVGVAVAEGVLVGVLVGCPPPQRLIV